MSRYILSDIRNKHSSSTSTPVLDTNVSLTTILEPLPEHTTTLSGTIPGHALYDTPPPASPKERELESAPESQRSQRPRTSTERGSLYVESREKSRERAEKIQRTKKRKSRQSKKVTSGHATDASTGVSDGGDLSSRAEAEDMPNMQDQASRTLSQEDRSSHGIYTGRGRSGGRNQVQARVQRRNRSTGGSGPKATTGSASDSDNDSDSSIDPVRLGAEVSKHLNYDVSNVSTQDLKAILRAITADQTPAVGSPRRKAKVFLPPSQQIKVGGGNHMDRLQTYSYKPCNTTNRTSVKSTYGKSKRQKLNYQNNNNSTTESETNYSIDTDHRNATAIDPETELKQDTTGRPTTPPSFRPSQYASSPSPLPPSHVPIDPEIIDFLDLPGQHLRRETLDTATQDSTVILETLGPQDSVSQQIQAPGQQGSFATDRITSAQRPLVSSGSLSTRRGGSTSTSSVSLGQPYSAPPKSTRPEPRLLPESRFRPHPIQSSSLRSSRICTPPLRSLGMLRSHGTRGQRTLHANKMHARPKGSTSLLQRQHIHVDADRSPSMAKTKVKVILQAASGSARVIAAAQARHRQRALANGHLLSLEQIDSEAGAFPHPSPGPSVRATPDLVPDNEEGRVAREAEANGEEPNCSKKRKPVAREIFGNERQILTMAKLHLFAYSLVEGAYQTRGTLMQWASDIFEVTWRQELPNLPYEGPSDRTLQIMVNSMATLRGKVKENLRPIVQYGYDFDKPATTSETISRNLKIFKLIHPNRFHCIDYKPVYGHYESNILTQAIAAALFNGPTAVGVLFRDFFEPLPLSTVAFVIANMQFCIEEWEYGFFQPRDLNTADMLNKYVAHFRGLKEAKAGALGRISRLQEDWFEFGFDYSGAIVVDEPYHQPITLRNEVRPDTPSEDLEEEPEHTPEPEPHDVETDGEGRYTARAKGKGRA